jgi:hypothetical protein
MRTPQNKKVQKILKLRSVMSIFLDLSGPKKIGVERILADLSYSRSSN